MSTEDSRTFPPGLTKRELFAAMAMQGLLSNVACNSPSHEWSALAPVAVELTDALIAELEKQP